MTTYSLIIESDPPIIQVSVGALPVISPLPLPVLTTLTPQLTIGGTGFVTLSLVGSGFVAGKSVVKFGATSLSTAFISATSLTATLVAGLVTVAGDQQNVTVHNPGPEGGDSQPVIFNVVSQAPNANSVAPSTALIGSADSTIVVTGTGFLAGYSTLKIDGVATTFTVDSFTQITGTITAAKKAAVGTRVITVTNSPGNSPGSSSSFFVQYAAPTIATSPAPSPNVITPGDPDTVVTFSGTGFYAGVTIAFLGATALDTNITSPTTATATILAALLASPGNASLTMQTPSPGGGTSNASTILIQNLVPSISGSTSSTGAYFSGTKSITLTVTGAVPTTTAWVNDGTVTRQVPCTYNSRTSVTLLLPGNTHWPSATLAAAKSITLTNPSPGGGTSNALTYTCTVPTAIKVWWRSEKVIQSGGLVTQFLDQSGNGNNSAVMNGGARPTYISSDRGGNPAVLFDGVANDARLTLSVANTSPWNWMISFTQVGWTAGRYIIGCTGAPSTGPVLYQNGTQVSGTGFNSGGGGFATGQFMQIGQGHTAQFIYNGASSDNIVNGGFALGALTSAGTGTATAFSLGSNMGGANSFTNFKIRELIGWGGTISAGEVAEYNAYRDYDDYGYLSNSKIVHLVTLGDSITNGVSAGDTPNKLVRSATGPRFGLPINRGTNGATSSDLSTNFSATGTTFALAPVLDVNYPNAVLLHIGINDAIILFRSAAAYIANVISIVTQFRAWCTANLSSTNAANSKFFIIKPAYGRNSADTAPNQATAEALRASYWTTIDSAISGGTLVVDGVYAPPVGLNNLAGQDSTCYGDDRHPNQKGQGLLFGAPAAGIKSSYVYLGA